MNNTATRMIRSEEITIDMRICTILAGGKKPGEVTLPPLRRIWN